MIITTGDHEAPEAVRRAQLLSTKCGVKYVRRNRTSVPKLANRYNDQHVVVVLEEGARLYRMGGDEPPLTFHPSMAFVRAKRLLRGECDAMLEASGIVPGDQVLDCTAGLGSDAAIFSMAVGCDGQVIALEDSLPLWALLHEGFAHYVSGMQQFDEAIRRIELRHANHTEVLQAMPDRSVDVVYFDPMFRDPIMESSAISPLRSFANNAHLEAATIKEAKRVARKSVVLKEKKGSEEFTRLGFHTQNRASTKIVYGVIKLGGIQ